MNLPKELTTVTTVSKSLAMFLFIAVPFVGFLLGSKYEQQFTDYLESRASVDQYIAKRLPADSQDAATENWKTYRNATYGFEIKYPPSWFLTEHIDISESYGNIVSIEDKSSGSLLINHSTLNTTGSNNPSIRYKTALIDNRKARLQEVYDGNQIIEKNYELTINSNILTISLTPHKVITFHIFDQILSTFKFTSP